MQCVELTRVFFSQQVSLVQLTFCMKMSLLIDQQCACYLSLYSCLSTWAKMPVTDMDSAQIPSGQRSETLGTDFMAFCDIFVRRLLFLPHLTQFVFWRVSINIKGHTSVVCFYWTKTHMHSSHFPQETFTCRYRIIPAFCKASFTWHGDFIYM